MAIKGSLREASLPDVLQLLAMGQKTGCLSVADRSNLGSIFFDHGRICHAAIVNRRDRLGEVLVKSGAISVEQLDAAMRAQARDRDRKLGELLVEQGAIARADLHQHVRTQIEEAVYFLFTWTEGTFNFEPDLRPDRQGFEIAINPETLLLEGARRIDEWSLIEKKIPSFDIVFEADHRRLDSSGVRLTREQELLLPLIDGRLDVAGLAEESGLAEFEVGKAIYGLAMAGFLHRVGKSRANVTMVVDTDVEQYRNLGVAFYKGGMFGDAENEFRKVVDKRPGDGHARFHLGLVQLRLGRWTDAVRHFEEAARAREASWSVFQNLALACERAGQLAKAREAMREAVARGGNGEPRVLMTLGVIALREGDLPLASASLADARSAFGARTPPPGWFHYAALVAVLTGRADDSISLLREGIKAYPQAARLHNNLAVALERVGQPREALAAALRGAAQDATIPQLHKNVGDAHFRAGNVDDAFDAYQRAIQLDESLGPDVWIKLGVIASERQQPLDAKRCWERALSLDPGNPVALQELATLNESAVHG